MKVIGHISKSSPEKLYAISEVSKSIIYRVDQQAEDLGKSPPCYRVSSLSEVNVLFNSVFQLIVQSPPILWSVACFISLSIQMLIFFNLSARTDVLRILFNQYLGTVVQWS